MTNHYDLPANSGLSRKEAAALLAGIAPSLHSALAGKLAHSALPLLEQALGISPSSDIRLPVRENAVLHGIGSATAAQLQEIRHAEISYKQAMHDILPLLPQRQETLEGNRHSQRTFYVSLVVLLVFVLVIGVSLWAGYALVTGAAEIKDTVMAEMVAGFGGTLLGYVSANAQQVMGYYFGGNRVAPNL
jgi:hypothetical protein